MAVSFVNSTAGAYGSAVLPGHQAGDLIVAHLANFIAIDMPTQTGADWIEVIDKSETNRSDKILYRIATSASEVKPTMTNTSYAMYAVYQGTDSIGVATSYSAASSTIRDYPEITPGVTDGTSWIVRSQLTKVSGSGSTLTGYTARRNTHPSMLYDSNAGVSTTQPQVALSINGSQFQPIISFSYELLDNSGGGGGGTTGQMKLKNSGTFGAKPMKLKSGGTFADAIVKTKVSGTWEETNT